MEQLSANAEVQGNAIPATDASAINASSLMQSAPDMSGAGNDVASQPAQQSSPAQNAQQATGNKSEQKEDPHWLGKRLESARRQVERTNEYQLGKMLLEERMASGMSAEEAFNAIQEERIKNRAEQYAKDPNAMYKDMARQTMRVPSQEAFAQQSEAQQLASQMQEAQANGSVPQGFDVSRDLTAPVNGTPFYELQQRFGIQAAFEMWKMSNQLNAYQQTQAMKSSPQPIVPSGNAAQPVQTDWRNMDSKHFAEIRRKVEQASRDGKRIRLQ